MRRVSWFGCLVALLLIPSGVAKITETHFKTVEAKHFSRAEGVELSPEFSDYLYAELRTELGKTKLFDQVIGEGEVVDDADAPQSLIIEGSITEYKKGSVAKQKIIGFGAGFRSLRLETTLTRRSDHKTLATPKIHVKAPATWNEKVLAREAAKHIAKEIKKELKEGNPPSS
jgi:uncharacterized protein DUF4410